MKHLLLASTALIATAGLAVAQEEGPGVALSGSAAIGVIGGDLVRTDELVDDNDNDIRLEDPDGNADDVQFFTDIDVTFTLSGATDGGLVFGANIDLDESDGDPSGAFDGTDQGGESIFVTGALGTLTMGDTDGALDFALQESVIASTLGDVNTEHLGFNGNSGLDGNGSDGQVARYQYTISDFSLAASFEIDDRGTDADGEFDGDNIYGVGGTYTGDFGGFTIGFGLGYQTQDDADIIGVSADINAGGFRAILNYSDYSDFDFDDGDGDGLNQVDNHIGIALGYEFNEFLVSANYGVFDTDDGDSDGYALSANYDLGGAELQLGYSDSEGVDGGSFDAYSFGISMAF